MPYGKRFLTWRSPPETAGGSVGGGGLVKVKVGSRVGGGARVKVSVGITGGKVEVSSGVELGRGVWLGEVVAVQVGVLVAPMPAIQSGKREPTKKPTHRRRMNPSKAMPTQNQTERLRPASAGCSEYSGAMGWTGGAAPTTIVCPA